MSERCSPISKSNRDMPFSPDSTSLLNTIASLVLLESLKVTPLVKVTSRYFLTRCRGCGAWILSGFPLLISSPVAVLEHCAGFSFGFFIPPSRCLRGVGRRIVLSPDNWQGSPKAGYLAFRNQRLCAVFECLQLASFDRGIDGCCTQAEKWRRFWEG